MLPGLVGPMGLMQVVQAPTAGAGPAGHPPVAWAGAVHHIGGLMQVGVIGQAPAAPPPATAPASGLSIQQRLGARLLVRPTPNPGFQAMQRLAMQFVRPAASFALPIQDELLEVPVPLDAPFEIQEEPDEMPLDSSEAQGEAPEEIEQQPDEELEEPPAPAARRRRRVRRSRREAPEAQAEDEAEPTRRRRGREEDEAEPTRKRRGREDRVLEAARRRRRAASREDVDAEPAADEEAEEPPTRRRRTEEHVPVAAPCKPAPARPIRGLPARLPVRLAAPAAVRPPATSPAVIPHADPAVCVHPYCTRIGSLDYDGYCCLRCKEGPKDRKPRNHGWRCTGPPTGQGLQSTMLSQRGD